MGTFPTKPFRQYISGVQIILGASAQSFGPRKEAPTAPLTSELCKAEKPFQLNPTNVTGRCDNSFRVVTAHCCVTNALRPGQVRGGHTVVDRGGWYAVAEAVSNAR